MELKNWLKLIGVVVLSIIVFVPLAISTTDMRGYWAVGGEIFVPIVILVWGIMTVFGGNDEN